MRRAIVLALLAGCPAPVKPEQAKPVPTFAITDPDTRAQNVEELRSDILLNYERDEAPEVAALTSVVLPRLDADGVAHPIGPVRIGAGPGDVLVAAELSQAPKRWPLDVPSDDPKVPSTEPRSKRLELHLSQDGLAAWTFDEVSWRVRLDPRCPRIAVIPLRVTSLYARTGDRWVLVFEHMSFARQAAPLRTDELPPRAFRSEVITKDLADDLSRIVSPVLYRKIDQARKVIGTGAEVMLLGPDVLAEWHGADVLDAKLVAGNMVLEDRLVGAVGQTLQRATVAYWVGNVTADLPARPGYAAGKAKLRGSFVFERRRRVSIEPGKAPKPLKTVINGVKNLRADPEKTSCADNDTDCDWVLVQGHVSQAITDDDLATAVFGTALISSKPLHNTCDDGGVVKPRAAAPGK